MPEPAVITGKPAEEEEKEANASKTFNGMLAPLESVGNVPI